MARSPVLSCAVSVLFDHALGFRTLQECKKRLGGFVTGSAPQKHCILSDRIMEIGGHAPSRAALFCDHLGECDEPKFRIAGIDKLERLRNIAALDDLSSQRVIDAKSLH